MSVYEKFARIYDRMGHDRFSIKMFAYSQKLLRQVRFKPKSVLDLACGTGSAALLWAAKRITVYGVDGSADMLSMARQKSRELGRTVDFSHQPLTTFVLPQTVDLVTCFFDSLNYLLTPEQLAATFRSVHRALNPGGYFIFDVNTPEAMRVLWDSQVYGDVRPDLAWIWTNYYFPKAKQAEVHATFFVRQGKLWQRFDELHAERGYSSGEIRAALKAADLKLVHMYECFHFTKPGRKSMRLAVVARKPK